VENDMSSYKKAVAVAVAITGIGIILVVINYHQISGRQGTIVIPAGNTYLGPSPSQAPSTAKWYTVKGHIYPYTMSVPSTLALTTFPNDPYDMYALMGNDPSSNVLIGVDDLSKNTARSQFTNQPKTAYINQWWKQFSVLTGVKSIDPFTNSKGLKGYKVKFLTASGESSNLDIFFEVPEKPQYIIHLSDATLDLAVFANIVDSVGWEK
jgi:hypothetical protein